MYFKGIRFILSITLVLCALLFMAEPSFALSANDAAPPIALRDSSGIYFYLSDYTGSSPKKPVKGIIVNFSPQPVIRAERNFPS